MTSSADDALLECEACLSPICCRGHVNLGDRCVRCEQSHRLPVTLIRRKERVVADDDDKSCSRNGSNCAHRAYSYFWPYGGYRPGSSLPDAWPQKPHSGHDNSCFRIIRCPDNRGLALGSVLSDRWRFP